MHGNCRTAASRCRSGDNGCPAPGSAISNSACSGIDRIAARQAADIKRICYTGSIGGISRIDYCCRQLAPGGGAPQGKYRRSYSGGYRYCMS